MVPLTVTVSLSNCVVVVVSAVSMCSQKVSVALASGGDGHRLRQRVGVGGAVAVEPGVPGAAVGGLAGETRPMTPEVAVHGGGAGLEAGVAELLAGAAAGRRRVGGGGRRSAGRATGAGRVAGLGRHADGVPRGLDRVELGAAAGVRGSWPPAASRCGTSGTSAPVVFISIALYMILMAFWMPRPVTVVPLQVGLVGWPLVGLVPSASR